MPSYQCTECGWYRPVGLAGAALAAAKHTRDTGHEVDSRRQPDERERYR